METIVKNYKYKKNRGFKDLPAEVVGNALETMADVNGAITPEMVLNEAKNKNHPLHNAFTWQNTEAAIKWRLHEARLIINSVEVIIEKNFKQIPVQAFVNIVEEGEDHKRVYKPVQVVMDNKAEMDYLVRNARAMLQGWITRFQGIEAVCHEEFEMVRKAHDQMKMYDENRSVV